MSQNLHHNAKGMCEISIPAMYWSYDFTQHGTVKWGVTALHHILYLNFLINKEMFLFKKTKEASNCHKK